MKYIIHILFICILVLIPSSQAWARPENDTVYSAYYNNSSDKPIRLSLLLDVIPIFYKS